MAHHTAPPPSIPHLSERLVNEDNCSHCLKERAYSLQIPHKALGLSALGLSRKRETRIYLVTSFDVGGIRTGAVRPTTPSLGVVTGSDNN